MGDRLGRWWALLPSAHPCLAGRHVALWQPRDGMWEVTRLSANAYTDMAAEDPPAAQEYDQQERGKRAALARLGGLNALLR